MARVKLGAEELVELGRARRRVCAKVERHGGKWIVRTKAVKSGKAKDYITFPCLRVKSRKGAAGFASRAIAVAYARKCGLSSCSR